MIVELDRKRKIPYYRQIIAQIRKKILAGELTAGAILPSERGLAEQLGVHRNTVIRAYALLKEEELIDSSPGRGYFVTGEESPASSGKPGKSVNWSHMIKDEYLDMKQTFDDVFLRFSEGSGISLSAGVPPMVYPEKEIGEVFASILGESELLPAFMGPYQGDEGLRTEIQRFLRDKGIDAKFTQIQVLTEINQAIDFIISAILEPGDSVIIEEPLSPDVYRMFQSYGCRCIAMPMDQDGMICDDLDQVVRRFSPKLIYVNSSYQDPTGTVLSKARRKKILEVSGKYRIPVIEEDAASGLNFEDRMIPSIKSMDRNGNVIYMYSFSLTFIPGVSLAAVVADEQLIRTLSHLVSIRIVAVDWMNQKLLAHYLKNGEYEKRIRKIADHCKKNRDIMCDYLDQLKSIGLVYQKPRGGTYIWCRLPSGLNGTDVADEALKQNVSVVPGEVFFPEKRMGADYLRLNYSYESSEWLEEGIKRLARVIRSMV